MNNSGISLVMKAPPLFQTLVPSLLRPTTATLKPASDHILTPFRLPQPEARRARRILIAGNEGPVHLPLSAATRVSKTCATLQLPLLPETRVSDFCAPLQLSSSPETRVAHFEMAIHLPPPDDVSPTHSARVLVAPLHIPPSARVSIDEFLLSDLMPRLCPSVAPPSCNVSPSLLPLIRDVSPPPSPKQPSSPSLPLQSAQGLCGMAMWLIFCVSRAT
ncbi:hypothetical protein Salat_0645500 [Sesamum alatum]|uniref:Uncharacterized protein n=1 Tax=Sesamum alatum TaxID=300844 RepID=A0AAE2CU93_9LAMI|nr:hypothetical protein Salat_0645500 [Sesamum alatum]